MKCIGVQVSQLIYCDSTARFVSDLVGNPNCWFCHAKAHMYSISQLSVDMSEIQFGTTVIDETLKRTFTLTNRGALGTKFDFFKVTGEFINTKKTHM